MGETAAAHGSTAKGEKRTSLAKDVWDNSERDHQLAFIVSALLARRQRSVRLLPRTAGMALAWQ